MPMGHWTPKLFAFAHIEASIEIFEDEETWTIVDKECRTGQRSLA